MEIALRVEDAISEEMLGGLEVTPRFYLEGVAKDLDLSLYGAGGSLVAGHIDTESFKSADIRVPGSGLLFLTLVFDDATDAMLNILTGIDGVHAKLNLVLSGDDHYTNIATFDILSESDLLEQSIQVMPYTPDSDFPAASVEGSVETDENVVSAAVSLSTPVKSDDTIGGAMLDGASMGIDISPGTELLDENGQPFLPVGEITLRMILMSGDPRGLSTTRSSPLFRFPGGLEISGISGNTPDDLTNSSEFSFISAGFAAVEIVDDAGNKVSSFRNGAVSLRFEVPKNTINPNTSLPLDFSDGSIPFWSYSDQTAQWSYEGEASIIADNGNTLTATTDITHLTYFNLDWYQSNRCQWDVSVVDANGQPNNQRLRLSFVRKSGGWAYRPYGWGGDPDRLNVRRIPAFEGTFDILSSDGTSLLDSITVDGVETSVTTAGSGIELSDFCFGLSTDSVKTFTAKLNVVNPPRLDLSLQVNLVCPTDSSSTVTTDSGSYYLYEGWSYIESGSVSNGQVDLRNLIEDGLYRFYYQNSTMWSRTEFSATENLTSLDIDTISVCPTVTQSLKTRLACLNSDQSIVKQQPAPSSRYWIYNRDYYQYLSGTTDAQGSDTLTGTVGGIDYVAYTRTLTNGRYQWHGPVEFTAEADQETVIDIPLSSSDSFCTDELPIDYTRTTLSASALSAPADGVETIQLTVQEKDEFGNDRSSNTGTLTLNAAPNDNVVIDNIQSHNDGTYTADIYASSPVDVVVSGAIDGNGLSDTVSVSFTDVAPSASQSLFTLSDTAVTTDRDVSASIVLKKDDGSDYGQSGGTLTLASTPPGATFSTVTDNGDGTYSATVSSASAATYSLTATVSSILLTANPSVSFTDPLPSASQSTFTLSASSATRGSDVTADITLKRSDGSDFGQSGGTLTLASSPPGATFSAVTDNGDGTYSATLSSTGAASYSLTATVGSVTLTANPSVTFIIPPLSAARSTFNLSGASATTEDSVTAEITLKRTDGSTFGESGGALVLSSSPPGAAFSAVTDNDDGTYSATINSVSPASYSLTATVGSVTLTTNPSVTFTNPPPSASLSTFTLGSAAVAVGTDVSIDITLRQTDGSAYGVSGGTLALSSTPPGATFGSVTDNGDGTYSATVGSAAPVDYTLSADIGGVTLTTTPAVSFTQVDATNTTVSPTSLIVSVAGGPEIVTLTLREADGSPVGHGGHTVSVASAFIDTLLIIPSPVITDNLDGTYTITATCTTAIGTADTVSVQVDTIEVDTFSLDCDL